MDRALIVGAGVGGLRAAERLRERGFVGSLTIVGDERHLPYSRPPLSKEFLAGTVEAGQCMLDEPDLGADWVLGDAAVGLDRDRHAVYLRSGRQLHYDGLVIATGRRAALWPHGPVPAGTFTLRTLDDAARLRSAAAAGRRIVIVGAGFVGCEVAATFRQQGLDVTVVDIAPHPMPVLGPAVGRYAQRLHEGHGVRWRLGTSVARIEGDPDVTGVRLSTGEHLPADLVLVALGSVANTEWLTGTGLTLNRGALVCDEQGFAVGDERIVAVGDVAAVRRPGDGDPRSVEHWSHAADMAYVAAANLLVSASGDEHHALESVPSFWSDQYDQHIKSAGNLARATRSEVIEEQDGRLVAEYHDGAGLVGAVTFNHTRAVIGYRRRLTETQAALT